MIHVGQTWYIVPFYDGTAVHIQQQCTVQERAPFQACLAVVESLRGLPTLAVYIVSSSSKRRNRRAEMKRGKVRKETLTQTRSKIFSSFNVKRWTNDRCMCYAAIHHHDVTNTHSHTWQPCFVTLKTPHTHHLRYDSCNCRYDARKSIAKIYFILCFQTTFNAR